MTPDELTPSFRGKGAKDQAQIVRRILDTAQRNALQLSTAEVKTFNDFIIASGRGIIPEPLLVETNKLVRQYEQLFIARTTAG